MYSQLSGFIKNGARERCVTASAELSADFEDAFGYGAARDDSDLRDEALLPKADFHEEERAGIGFAVEVEGDAVLGEVDGLDFSAGARVILGDEMGLNDVGTPVAAAAVGLRGGSRRLAGGRIPGGTFAGCVVAHKV